MKQRIFYVIKVMGDVTVGEEKMGELVQYFSPLPQSLVASPEEAINAYYTKEEAEELIAAESQNWEEALGRAHPSFHIKQWGVVKVTILIEEV